MRGTAWHRRGAAAAALARRAALPAALAAVAAAFAAAPAAEGLGGGDLDASGSPVPWIVRGAPDAPPYGAPAFRSGILEVPDEYLRPGAAAASRYVVLGGSAGFAVSMLDEGQAGLLRARGHTVIPDFKVDLHAATPAKPPEDASRIPELASALRAMEQNYTGKGVRVAVVDTGVDFSNPDMRHSLARDPDTGAPVMLDADGQGIVLTNATFAANIDGDGIIRNVTGSMGENHTSVVYRTGKGVFLDVERGGKGTIIEVYNSLFPESGPAPVFNGTLYDDMRIGEGSRDYIRSASGVYRLGMMYQGSLSGPITALQVVPVLSVDSEEPGVYDTIIADMSTSWLDYSKSSLPRGQEPEFDFDFTDEKRVKLGGGSEFLVHDHDGDGEDDYSAGTVGASVVDVYGVMQGNGARGGGAPGDGDGYIVNGTALPPIDPGGRFFGVMTDFGGHGTSGAAAIASAGEKEYDVYNDTGRYVMRGVAPGAAIVPVKALWFGNSLYASLWAAGFDSAEGGWRFSGAPRADVMSHSWGVSAFPLIGSAPGADIVSLLHGMLATPHSLDRRYPGVVVVASAGNSGPGYGTLGTPGASPFVITVGATTSNAFVGYGPFEGQPRFGNSTGHGGHVADFSSRGPGMVGDPKPDIVGLGAYGFVPASVLGPPPKRPPPGEDPEGEKREPFRMFGGTSMAAPIVAGAAALVIQAMQEKSPVYSPADVKVALASAATDAGNDPLVQGAGIVNVDAAISAARGDAGHYYVGTGATYANLRMALEAPLAEVNHTAMGLDRFVLPPSDVRQPSWFAGRLEPGGRSTADIIVSNPSAEPLRLEVEPQRLALASSHGYAGSTEPHMADAVHGGPDAYAPNYVALADAVERGTLASYFRQDDIPEDAPLLVLSLRQKFGEFMNQSDPLYANDTGIASLYLYDWEDKDGDGLPSSDELSLVSRAGSWGTVQEMRVSDPASRFQHTPLVGAYPVPSRYSYWTGELDKNATSMGYWLSADYYGREPWRDVWLDRRLVEVPPGSSAAVTATVVAPPGRPPGIYQGFLRFSGTAGEDGTIRAATVDVPVSYAVAAPAVRPGGTVLLAGGNGAGGMLYGNGYVRGAFDMASRYTAGDWRVIHFEADASSGTDTAVVDASWEDPDTSISMLAVDPRGRIVQSTAPPGAFGPIMGWPSSDWLGPTPFSEGGGFYPVEGRSPTSTGMYLPINQTGTYSLLLHSVLFGGANSTAEGIRVAASFADLQPDPPGG